MKKLFLITIACCIAAAVSAQIKLTLVLNAAPPAQLSEWGTRREVLMLIVSPPPPGSPPADFKLKTEIKTSDGTVIGTTDLNTAPIFSAGSTGQLILTANDVMPLDKMIFTGKYKNSLQRTGKLPSDNYIMCVTAVRPQDYTPMSPPECKSFYLASTQLPILLKPYDGEVLDAKIAQTAITFRWSSIVPKPTTMVRYRVQVFEILENQNPVQAMRSNMPLLDKEVIGTTQYIWRPQLSFHVVGTWDGDCTGGNNRKTNPIKPDLEPDQFRKTNPIKPDMEPDQIKKIDTITVQGDLEPDVIKSNPPKNDLEPDTYRCQRFIWTVQTLDDKGIPVTQTDGTGEARSEPIVFTVKMKVKEKGRGQ